MQPAIVMLDEIEKAFAGVGGSGQSDGGVGSRMFGTFLSWLNDRESDVYVVVTANSVDRLPPEFARAERFDSVFFLDLPTREEKDAIWDIYHEVYQLDANQDRPSDTDWTGAEIKACCRLSILLGIPLVEAAKNVVPVAVTASESIGKLREWATGRCLDATGGGIFQHKKSRKRRKLTAVGPNPSTN
jgi:SpoVK/Ycf46/Vps4 family AAA+-type ATPase